jgi:F-type H+-transporting ATPase subunit b
MWRVAPLIVAAVMFLGLFTALSSENNQYVASHGGGAVVSSSTAAGVSSIEPAAGVETTTEASPAEHSEHAASGGLPQFDPTWFTSQLFWLAICFGLVLLVFGRSTLPKIAGILEARRETVTSTTSAAEHLSAEVRHIQEMYGERLKHASEEAAHEVTAAEKVAKDKMAASLQEFRSRFDLEVSVTESRLEQAKAQATQNMNIHVAGLAAQAAEKLAGVPANQSDAESVVQSLSKKAEAA